jgi:hypothetical protein
MIYDVNIKFDKKSVVKRKAEIVKRRRARSAPLSLLLLLGVESEASRRKGKHIMVNFGISFASPRRRRGIERQNLLWLAVTA